MAHPSPAISFHGYSGKELLNIDDIKNNNDEGKGNAIITLMVDYQPVRRPLGPRQLPLMGNYFEIYPDHIGNHERLLKRFGSVIKTVNMGITTYITNDPRVSEVVLGENEFFTKTVSDPVHPLYYMRDETSLFTCDTTSPAFKTAHKFIAPGLSPRAVRNYFPGMQKAVEASFTVFDELDRREQAFHAYQFMFKLGGEIIYKVVLGLETNHFRSVDTPPHEMIRLLGSFLQLVKQSSLSPRWFTYLPFSKAGQALKVRSRLVELVEDAIQKCQPGGRSGMGEDEPIQEAALTATCVVDYLNRAADEGGCKLPHELLISNLAVLLGAGLSTSAALLSWLVYALSVYPGNQERLVQELVDYRKKTSTGWDYEEVLGMPFLDAFVKETLRLHSPTFQTARNAKQDVVVPGGWQIPQGSLVIPTFPAVHRNKDYWDNPERFDPDRWLNKTKGKVPRHRLAFTPFASGPRGCVGYNVALLETKLVLANLVYRYAFVNASKEPVVDDPEFVVVRPSNLYVRAVQRSSWPERTTTE
ncbi:hypothetical protein N0V82_008477 [Gnomoniopsis sp. IMI 355080]|nr:hypothetical protein N0V82_008477 [Gnomoniopsis sp. IMI 355080]